MDKRILRIFLSIGITTLFIGTTFLPLIQGVEVRKSSYPLSNGKTHYVGGSGPGNYTNIQDAINNSVDGFTIFVYDDSSPYYENLFIDISINLIGENKDTTIIDGRNIGDVAYVTADFVNITGFTFQNSKKSSSGLCLWESNNCIISNNKFINNYWNFNVIYSDYNIIEHNKITEGYRGLFLSFSCFNTLLKNDITLNINIGLSICKDSISNSVISNNIHLNTYYGMSLNLNCVDNTLIGNSIKWNGLIGLKILDSCDKNNIYCNNFIDNAQNADDVCDNFWDSGIKGNFWSDYTGEDSNGDGIGDTPYTIPGDGNQDNYPLMEPYENRKPNKPSIDGPTNGIIDIPNTYTFNSVDPDGDDIYYYILWGDGYFEPWEGPIASGEDFIIDHTFQSQGTFTIQVKVRDQFGVESGVATLEVTIPRNRATYEFLFLRIIERFPNAFPILRQLFGFI